MRVPVATKPLAKTSTECEYDFWKGCPVHRFVPPLASMIEGARKIGFITYQQVDNYLPDEGGDPRMVDDLIQLLAELGLYLCGDPNVPDDDKLL